MQDASTLRNGDDSARLPERKGPHWVQADSWCRERFAALSREFGDIGDGGAPQSRVGNWSYAIVSRAVAWHTLLVPPTTLRGRAWSLTRRALQMLRTEGPRACLIAARKKTVSFSLRVLRRGDRELSRGLYYFHKLAARCLGRTDDLGRLPEQMIDRAYEQWRREFEPRKKDLRQQRVESAGLAYRPLISILTPAYKTPPRLLLAAYKSLCEQTYENWEWCLAEGFSDSPKLTALMQRLAARDPRVRIRFLEKNGGISGNTNAALEMAHGEYIALLDHDDLLPPWALFEVAKKLNEDPTFEFLYSDRDMVSGDGRQRFSPLFKPDWSPEMILSANYLTHLCVIRTERARNVGGFRSETDGAQDWDFFLRVTSGHDRVAHIPKVLYHWRFWSNSCASRMEAKPYVFEAQRRTMQDHLRREGIQGTAEIDKQHLFTRVRPPQKLETSLSLIVLTTELSGRVPQILKWVQARDRQTPVEIVIAHCGPCNEPLEMYYDHLAQTGQAKVVRISSEIAATSSQSLNTAAHAADGDILLFLHDAAIPCEGDWLGEIATWAMNSSIGAVGAKVVDAEGTVVQGAGVFGLEAEWGHLFSGTRNFVFGPFGHSEWYRNCLVVGPYCLAICRNLFLEMQGFDERFDLLGAMTDLCLRLNSSRRRNLFNPHVVFQLAGRHSPRVELSAVDRELLRDRILFDAKRGDPFYNINLSRRTTIPGLRQRGEELTFPGLPETAEAAVDSTKIAPTQTHNIMTVVARLFNYTQSDLEANQRMWETFSGKLEVRTLNWVVPHHWQEIIRPDSLAFAFANYLQLQHNVKNRFYIEGHVEVRPVQDRIAVLFPGLHDAPVRSLIAGRESSIIEFAEGTVATDWTSAYSVLRSHRTRRKFYFPQSLCRTWEGHHATTALMEAVFRFGFIGITDRRDLKEHCENVYGSDVVDILPAVNTHLYSPAPASLRLNSQRKRVFLAASVTKPAEGFELAAEALRRIKRRHGSQIEFLTAGEHWKPADFDLEGVIHNYGPVEEADRAELYRSCHAVLALRLSEEVPLPLPFMASGCVVVTNRPAGTHWLLRDGKNCVMSELSADCLAARIVHVLQNGQLSEMISQNALEEILQDFAEWRPQFEKLFQRMSEPLEGYVIPASPWRSTTELRVAG